MVIDSNSSTVRGILAAVLVFSITLFFTGGFSTDVKPCPTVASAESKAPVVCPAAPPATKAEPAPVAVSPPARRADLDGLLTAEQEKKMVDACPSNRRLRADATKAMDVFIKETFRVLNEVPLKDVWDKWDPRPIEVLARNSDKIFEKHEGIREGFWAEFGVFQGGTLKMASESLTKNNFGGVVAGFDSFQGLPVKWRGGFEAGTFAQKDLYQRVRGYLPQSVELYKGWFQETIGTFKAKYPRKPATLIHHDGDLFISTTITFQMLADRIVPGTHMIFDELQGYPGYKGHEILALFLWMVEHEAEICAMGIREQIKDEWFEETAERDPRSQSAWFQVLSTKASRAARQ